MPSLSPSHLKLWVSSNPAPKPWPRGAVSCPECGRDIPGATRPRGGKANRVEGPGWMAPKSTDLASLCAIDGQIGAGLTPRSTDLETITAAAMDLAAECERGRELRWAAMLRKSASRPPAVRSIYIAHALAIFHRRGPWTGGVVVVDIDRLRQTVVDIVARWEPGPI